MRLPISSLIAMLCLGGPARAESWFEALKQMPLNAPVKQLTRTNCIPVMLAALRSNATVKALIFLPGATDELYFFRRVQATVANRNPTLLDAVVALTNQSPLRATFRPPFLLVHSAEDVIELDVTLKHAPTMEKLKRTGPSPHWVFNDRDWDTVRKSIKKPVRVGLVPWPHTRGMWHFYRHSFASWNLTAWETLEAVAFAGKTKFIVRRGVVEFQPDERVGVIPKLDHFPR